jgi:sugar-specific transcriptional regulator TrmB
VYLAALELGQASMQDLADNSGVKRTSIYNFIDELVKKQLIVTSRKKKRLLYSAMHPNQLLEIEKTKLAEIQNQLPELLAIYNKPKNKPKVTFYEGVNGIKEVLADMLKEKQPISAWSDYKEMASVFGDYYFDVFPAERARKKIISRNIVPDSDKAREFKKMDNRYLRETKISSLKDIKTEINIYGNKVALNSYGSNPPFAVIIEDRDIAETLRSVWDRNWQE